jgi:hypothetical protein
VTGKKLGKQQQVAEKDAVCENVRGKRYPGMTSLGFPVILHGPHLHVLIFNDMASMASLSMNRILMWNKKEKARSVRTDRQTRGK